VPEPHLSPDWTRVSVFLPANNSAEMKAIRNIQHQIMNNFPGMTISVLRPNVFDGFYLGLVSGVRTILKDNITLIIIDINQSMDNPTLDTDLASLKIAIHAEYSNASSPQGDIWIVVHPLYKLI
jgi:hypothetical protein